MIDKNRINRLLVSCLAILLMVFAMVLVLQLVQFMKGGNGTKSCDKRVCLKKFLDGPPAFNDPVMGQYIREKYIVSPSGQPRNIPSKRSIGNPSASFNYARQYINRFFKHKRNGKFVVLGAGDGVVQDFTVDLEINNDWTGLLVEPNPDLFEKLKAKNRNADMSNTCISPYTYPSQQKFQYPSLDGFNDEDTLKLHMRETKLSQLWDKDIRLTTFTQQCLPLTNLLYASPAISSQPFDLLVMDMAGTDLDVLAATSLDEIPPFEMAILVAHGDDLESDVAGFFLEKNMVVTKHFGENPNDNIFVISKFKAESDGL